MDETLAFTVDDDGNVLELIRSDAEGVFVRENGDWSPVDTAADQPTVDDLEWLDATPGAVEFWDGLTDTENVTRESVLEYTAQGE